MKKLILIFLLLALSGCIQNIGPRPDGKPSRANIINIKVKSENIKIKYAFIKSYDIKEDDEFYNTYHAYNIVDPIFHKIKDPTDLDYWIYVFNPDKKYYKIITYTRQPASNKLMSVDTIYSGNLSRNEFDIKFPMHATPEVEFYFDVLDEKDNLLFKSVTAHYSLEIDNNLIIN